MLIVKRGISRCALERYDDPRTSPVRPELVITDPPQLLVTGYADFHLRKTSKLSSYPWTGFMRTTLIVEVLEIAETPIFKACGLYTYGYLYGPNRELHVPDGYRRTVKLLDWLVGGRSTTSVLKTCLVRHKHLPRPLTELPCPPPDPVLPPLRLFRICIVADVDDYLKEGRVT